MTDKMTPFEPQSMSEAIDLAKLFAPSTLLPKHLVGRPADVMITMLTGRELGLSPMQALRSMYVVGGKASLGADMMVALCIRERDLCVYFQLVESTDERAVYETQRKGAPQPTRMSFTMSQAKSAGLLSNQTWQKYPAAMLRARCSAALCRAVYPDLLAGVYETGEAEEIAAPQKRTPIRGVVRDEPVVEMAQLEAAPEPEHDALSAQMPVDAEVVEVQQSAATGETPAAVRARLLAACSVGWLDWDAKRAWSKANKAAKDALSPEVQEEIRAAFVAASPTAAVTSNGKPTTTSEAA